MSNLGNIRSLNYRRMNIIKNLKPGIEKKTGYLSVTLLKNNKQTTKQVHQLVAKNFISNDSKKNIINHKNGIKIDNRVENLEFCTYSENELHAYRIGLKKVSDKQRKASSENLKKWRKYKWMSK